MSGDLKLSHTAAIILHAIAAGHSYGFNIMEATGLPSGTIYPAMRRMERDELIRAAWEDGKIADREQRPARRYYKVTGAGRSALKASLLRYPLLEGMFRPKEQV